MYKITQKTGPQTPTTVVTTPMVATLNVKAEVTTTTMPTEQNAKPTLFSFQFKFRNTSQTLVNSVL